MTPKAGGAARRGAARADGSGEVLASWVDGLDRSVAGREPRVAAVDGSSPRPAVRLPGRAPSGDLVLRLAAASGVRSDPRNPGMGALDARVTRLAPPVSQRIPSLAGLDAPVAGSDARVARPDPPADGPDPPADGPDASTGGLDLAVEHRDLSVQGLDRLVEGLDLSGW